jgi:predicted transcriptional regulator
MRQLTFQEHMLFPSNLKKMKEMARWENYRLLHRTGALEDKPEVITEEMDIQTIIFNTLRKKKTMSFQELAGRTNIKDSSLRGYLMHLLNAKRVKRYERHDGRVSYQAVLSTCPFYKDKRA